MLQGPILPPQIKQIRQVHTGPVKKSGKHTDTDNHTRSSSSLMKELNDTPGLHAFPLHSPRQNKDNLGKDKPYTDGDRRKPTHEATHTLTHTHTHTHRAGFKSACKSKSSPES